jgi:hypothetical protein
MLCQPAEVIRSEPEGDPPHLTLSLRVSWINSSHGGRGYPCPYRARHTRARMPRSETIRLRKRRRFPSWEREFDSRHPLFLKPQVSNLGLFYWGAFAALCDYSCTPEIGHA